MKHSPLALLVIVALLTGVFGFGLVGPRSSVFEEAETSELAELELVEAVSERSDRRSIKRRPGNRAHQDPTARRTPIKGRLTPTSRLDCWLTPLRC